MVGGPNGGVNGGGPNGELGGFVSTLLVSQRGTNIWIWMTLVMHLCLEGIAVYFEN